jgi:hypothetical protein
MPWHFCSKKARFKELRFSDTAGKFAPGTFAENIF